MEPTQKEIDDTLDLCGESRDNGSKYPGMTYEDGVDAAIRWMQGDQENPLE